MFFCAGTNHHVARKLTIRSAPKMTTNTMTGLAFLIGGRGGPSGLRGGPVGGIVKILE